MHKKDLLVGINTILSNETKDEIKKTIDMWKEKVDHINIQSYLVKQSTPDSRTKDQKNKENKYAICDSPAINLTVFWDGKASVCCFDDFGDLIVGDLKKSTIKEVWDGEKINKLRKNLRTGEIKNTLCAKCPATKR